MGRFARYIDGRNRPRVDPRDIRAGAMASPLLDHDVSEASVFQPQSLLEGASRQKRGPPCRVPAGCLLDMDGELLDHLLVTHRAMLDATWPCFHTDLYRFNVEGDEFGIIAGTVGAPFAVLIAEELFAAGCDALVSISSAGLIASEPRPPFFVLIERALRDEGTSHHYLKASRHSEAEPAHVQSVAAALEKASAPFLRGTSWTTDAPFRETGSLIEARRAEGIICVEMEAAGLLAMSRALGKPVVCLAHVTNAMATRPDDFDKGGQLGQEHALGICAQALKALLLG
jgi:uridine phosphorylase